MCQRLLLLTALTLWAIPAAALDLSGTCQVQFTGSSTLHDFAGTGACEPFVLQAKEAGGDPLLADATLTVAVAGMLTGNTSRDLKMREMFAADQYPRIAGILNGGTVTELRQKLHEASQTTKPLSLRLRIREVEAPVAARVTQLADDPRNLSFDLEFPVSLAAYRLEAPSVLGLIRVADEVRVKVSLRLTPLPTAWQPQAAEPAAPR
jgi:hypothetical protein